MGKTSQPLHIWVWHPWLSRSAVGALHNQGHFLSAIGSEGDIMPISPGALPLLRAPDLILHPAAHWWTEEMFASPTYLTVALKRARARRKEPNAK